MHSLTRLAHYEQGVSIMAKVGSAYGYPSKVEAVDASDSDYEQDRYDDKGMLKFKHALDNSASEAATPSANLSYGAIDNLGSGSMFSLANRLVENSGRYPANRTVSCSLNPAANLALAKLTILLGCSRAELASRLLDAAIEDLAKSVEPR